MAATRRQALAGAAALAALSAGPASGASAPRRVVSLAPCLDALLVALADRSQISALSRWSRQAGGSTIVAAARALPFTYGGAEEIALLAPDLVISGVPTPQTLQRALPRLGIPLAMFKVVETVDESLRQIGEVARLIGHPQRGEALARRIASALAAAAPPVGARPVSALVFQRDGFASGPATLMDEMLGRTGFTNAARRYGMTASGNVPMERLLADPPDVLLVGESAGAVSWGERVLRHPALRGVRGRMRPVLFPAKLMYCGGPVLIATAAALAAARRAAAEASA